MKNAAGSVTQALNLAFALARGGDEDRMNEMLENMDLVPGRNSERNTLYNGAIPDREGTHVLSCTFKNKDSGTFSLLRNNKAIAKGSIERVTRSGNDAELFFVHTDIEGIAVEYRGRTNSPSKEFLALFDGNAPVASPAPPASTKKTGPLSKQEAETLAKHEATIFRAHMMFFEMGEALREIKDKDLFRASYRDFPTYCREHLDMSAPTAYGLINAAERYYQLKEAGFRILPSCVAQVTPLTRISKDASIQVWTRVLDASPDAKRITTKKIVRFIPGAPRPAKTLGDIIPALERVVSHIARYNLTHEELQRLQGVAKRFVGFLGKQEQRLHPVQQVA